MKAAYKQLARSPEHAWASVIAVWSPAEKKTVFFESVALLFGAVSAVISFNRAARALRDILCKLFRIAATNFFDDFCTVEGEPLCQNCLTVSEMVMQLLGWRISMGEAKRFPFKKKFQILGAVMSFEGSTEGLVAVENKPDRISSIRRACEECQKGGLTDADLASLKGKLLYAAGHTFGKATQLAVQLLGRQAARIKQDQQRILQAVLEVVDVLAAARPRVLRPMGCEPPVIVFTDGACEQDGKLVTHGAVLCDPLHSVKEFFGGVIPEALVTEWASSGSRQLIGQAEIYPVVLAKATWAGYLAKRKVIWFIDNGQMPGWMYDLSCGTGMPEFHLRAIFRMLLLAWSSAATKGGSKWSRATRVCSRESKKGVVRVPRFMQHLNPRCKGSRLCED